MSPDATAVGVIVVAVGSSNEAANARTATVAPRSAAPGPGGPGARSRSPPDRTRPWPRPPIRLRAAGRRRLVVAPWFLAHGRITDRVAAYAAALGISMAEPLGSHNLVAATVLDRFDAIAAGQPLVADPSHRLPVRHRAGK